MSEETTMVACGGCGGRGTVKRFRWYVRGREARQPCPQCRGAGVWPLKPQSSMGANARRRAKRLAAEAESGAR